MSLHPRSKLKLLPFVVGWIMTFLSNRTRATKLGFLLSNLAAFNMSVVQGSGIGPFLFIVYMLDLRALDILNYLLKYADDTTLINPESARVTAEEEMQHLFDWAKLNKMNINPNKTKEMVFHRPNPRSFVPPCEMADFRRVHSVKLFGVEFNSALDFNAHISAVVNCCNQRLYQCTSSYNSSGSAFLLKSATQFSRPSLSVNSCMLCLPSTATFLRLLKINCLQFCAKQNGGS